MLTYMIEVSLFPTNSDFVSMPSSNFKQFMIYIFLLFSLITEFHCKSDYIKTFLST